MEPQLVPKLLFQVSVVELDLTIDIESFEQQYIITKDLLQWERLEKHMVSIAIDQYLSNSAMYEHICLENINKLYKSAGKFDDQQQYKAIIEEEMVYTPVVFTDNSPMSPSQYMTMKNTSTRKPLRQFLDTL